MYIQFIEYFSKGGPMMWPLLLLSILGLMFTLERFYHYHRATINTNQFLTELKKALSSGNVKAAIQKCETYRGPIASIIKAGLLKVEKGKAEVEKALEFSATLEMARLERGLMVLISVSNIGPLIGFLGTVTGMIKSFDAIAKAGLNNPALVAIGISEALITTATGLIVAIPFTAAYNYFTTKIARLVLEMEESAEIMLEMLDDYKLAKPSGGNSSNLAYEKTRPL